MPSLKNKELIEKYNGYLQESSNFLMARYSGLSVSEITNLRAKLHEQGLKFTVIKNNIFKLALQAREDLEDFPYDSTLQGPIGVVFAGEDVPAAAKTLKDYSKENEKFQIMSGVMESKFYDEKGVEALAGLPSKEELLATLAASLNSPATKMAGVMNNIMGSLARAIKAVGEKNG